MRNFIDNIKNKKIQTILILAVSLIFFTGCKKDNSATPITGGFDENKGLVIAGNIDDDNVDISSKISGTVEKIYKDKGDFIKKGELIVKLDDETVRAKIAQLEAQANQAQAAMNAQSSVSNSQIEQATGAVNAAMAQVEQVKGTVNVAESQLKKARAGARNQEIQQLQAQYNLYKDTYKRISGLYKEGSVTKQKYDEAYTQMRASQEQLSLAKEGARKEDIRTAEAQVEQAKGALKATIGQVEQAKGALNVAKSGKSQIAVYQAQYKQAMAGIQEANISLKDTSIYSPCDGTIMEMNIKEGELAVAGMNITSINNLQQTELNLKVYETDLQSVGLNKKVKIRLLSTGEKEFEGIVKTVLSKPSFATKRASHNDESDVLAYEVKVEAKFPNDIRIYPGMTAYVQFPNDKKVIASNSTK